MNVTITSQSERPNGDPHIARAVHLEQDGGGDAERDGGQQLVGDAEQRPQRVDAAQRIAHALVEEVAPGQHDHGAGARSRRASSWCGRAAA